MQNLRNEILQQAPLLRICLVLILGILVGDAFGAGLPLWLGYVISAGFLICAIGMSFWKIDFKNLYGKPVLVSVFIFLSLFSFSFYFVSAREAYQKHLYYIGESTYEAVVVSPPAVRGKVVRFEAIVTSGERPFPMQVSLLRDTLINRYRQLRVGKAFLATSDIEGERHKSKPSTFIYYRNWQEVSPDYSALSVVQRARLRLMLFREKLVREIRQYGEGTDEEAVIAAMVLGDKSSLTKELREKYSVSGASHVLALSGLHLSIVYFFLTFVFFRLRWRVLGQIVVLPAIWMYAMMVGFSPSVVRAATMLSVFAFVDLLHRQAFSLNTLSLAAIIMLIGDPFNLWDIGFQLSFLAVLGIKLFNSLLYRLMDEVVFPSSDLPYVLRITSHREDDRRKAGDHTWWRKCVRWLIGMIAVSLAAQLMTAPLVAHYFGRFSCYFLLTNLVAIPLVTIILYASFFIFVFSFSPFLQSVVGQFVITLSGWLNGSLSLIASQPYASIENLHVGVGQTLLLYVLLAILVAIFCLLLKVVANNSIYQMR